ncbi:poly [ADP-ribose] polymerase 2-like isoform X2 [Saccoglossus kowalevskii]|uniref:Poly [ADP-ribose] polymerase n=1 Tax=Saccoglossus kowalevskii TaxID=10224 RepID=A0ABM0ME20_SACKO|nr:PREDICTED: poly [ADP-ribose] polymerase 2-like [Saccoglossus kowalevskii]
MPPRRRKAASAADTATEAKKPKTELVLSWEWEGDAGKWTAYDEDQIKEINDTFDEDKNKIEFIVGPTKFNVLLDKMVQKNAKTGWERRLRCLIKDDNDYFVWQWQDEKNKWNPYNVKNTVVIEASHKAGSDNVGIEALRRTYTIDLKKMEQINDDTDVTRKIERLQVDHKPLKTVAAAKASTAKVKSEAPVKKSKNKVKEEDTGNDVKSSTSKSSMKTVIVKGKAPVDSECEQKIGVAHVYWEGNDIYNTMLNQTNLMNNNNKYYLIQLLEDDNKPNYSVWMRWGRVGKHGQTSLFPCGSNLDEAKKIFMKKFRDKTLNDWYNRKKFVKVQGKYDMLEMDYSAKDANETETDSKKKIKKEDIPVPDSKLDKRVQDLIELICNVKAMEDMVIEMKYDAKKAPLGKLTEEQINAGYSALKEIEYCINNNVIGNRLIQACDAYYTRVPHDFGMKRPPIIRTVVELQREIDLIEALGDIQIAMTIIKKESNELENPVDRHYKSLKCNLEPLDKKDSVFKLINDYVQNTHAITHNQYKMEVLDVFEMEKEGEKEQFKDLGNRMLLWHGSRLTNYVGILSKGLRIAPPEAPVTGYMFGKGIYFADMSSKSANYCFATKSNNVGFCLLCEVSLGKPNELLSADYNAAKLPAGTHSVHGLGMMAPDPTKKHTMSDGTVVPIGKGKKTGVANKQGYTLNYNEFIVYNTNQVKMRYLVKVKFHFK